MTEMGGAISALNTFWDITLVTALNGGELWGLHHLYIGVLKWTQNNFLRKFLSLWQAALLPISEACSLLLIHLWFSVLWILVSGLPNSSPPSRRFAEFFLGSFFISWSLESVSRQKAMAVIGNFFFQLSGNIVLCCQCTMTWKQLFHIYCPVFQLFQMKEY